MNSPNSPEKSNLVRDVLIGIIVAVVSGVIVAYLIKDARFSPSEPPIVQTPQIPTQSPTNVLNSSTPSSLSLYDSFNDFAYDGQYDKSLWFCEMCNPQGSRASQQNDSLRFEVFSEGAVTSVELKSRSVWKIDEIVSLEGQLRFDDSAESGGLWLAAGEANCFIRVAEISSKRLVFQCGFVQVPNASGQEEWQYATDEIVVDFARWYTMQIVFDHETDEIRYYLDGTLIGQYIPSNPNSVVEVRFGTWADTTRTVAYVDEVSLKTTP